MVWVVYKTDGSGYHRAPNGLPLYAASKKAAIQLARDNGLSDADFYVGKVVN